MATGRSTQLTGQIGEHLVAAGLGRMGFVAAPFAGNVPHFIGLRTCRLTALNAAALG
jgi:hypothetical protein